MKKLILASAAVLFISMASIAQDANNGKKIVKKENKECMKDDGTCSKKCGPGECAKDAKCKESKSCAKHCSMDEKK